MISSIILVYVSDGARNARKLGEGDLYAPRSSIYHRREPEPALLYRTVQTHLATWLARQDDGTGETAPAAIEREFRRDLECWRLPPRPPARAPLSN